jgi:hypothetical protein
MLTQAWEAPAVAGCAAACRAEPHWQPEPGPRRIEGGVCAAAACAAAAPAEEMAAPVVPTRLNVPVKSTENVATCGPGSRV